MIEHYSMLFALVAGVILGSSFFYSLWFTVQKGLQSPHPERWFIGGFVLRMSITLVGFYFISNQQFWLLILCLLGFLIGRVIINRVLAVSGKPEPA
ncbi:ATP synthase subunit I [Aliiglaciecola sp. 3_MG-2023]|uniref:N-ATPase subunit AtpR n=1 Tax=Aliiglaciecola sp. 3_MG-2023 TaxID=3062644 RepID=UPI0026E49117|nr:ATP synthase subunit I [Aliiglaciecola sp. 3_MG-2023]MDO6693542.1 ATP synthase subunit I [Aliiglaciecola sp. 3_MG-2023]